MRAPTFQPTGKVTDRSAHQPPQPARPLTDQLTSSERRIELTVRAE
jgi:hypothetical protein